MSKFVSTLLAAVLTVLMSTSAFAATVAQDDTVVKTFELSIFGTVPAGEVIFLAYIEEGEDLESGGTTVIVCGDFGEEGAAGATELLGEEMPTPDDVDIISDQPCESDTAYTYEVEFARGTGIAYVFARFNVNNPDDFEIIASLGLDEEGNPTDYEELTEDMINAAEYDYGTAQPQPGQPQPGQPQPGQPQPGQPQPGQPQPQLPGTGLSAADYAALAIMAGLLLAVGGLTRRLTRHA